jgi:hypothetical protein
MLLVLALALPLGACGSSGSSSGGHHVLADVFCAVTVYHLYRDVKAHRLGWAAFSALVAHHSCKQAFRKP